MSKFNWRDRGIRTVEIEDHENGKDRNWWKLLCPSFKCLRFTGKDEIVRWYCYNQEIKYNTRLWLDEERSDSSDFIKLCPNFLENESNWNVKI